MPVTSFNEHYLDVSSRLQELRRLLLSREALSQATARITEPDVIQIEALHSIMEVQSTCAVALRQKMLAQRETV
jgi:hypothetical protein